MKGRDAEAKTKRYFAEILGIALERTPNSEGTGRPDYRIDGMNYIEVKAGKDGIRKEQIYWMAKNIHKNITIIFANITPKFIPIDPKAQSQYIYDIDIGFYNKREVEILTQELFKIIDHYFKRLSDIDYEELSNQLITLKKYTQFEIDEAVTVLIKRGILYKSSEKKIEVITYPNRYKDRHIL